MDLMQVLLLIFLVAFLVHLLEAVLMHYSWNLFTAFP